MAAVLGPGLDPDSYAVALEASPKRVRVMLGSEVVADSTRVQLLFETKHLPVYYFPLEDIRADTLVPSDRSTHCPHKGDARYWSVKVGDREASDALWNYPDPIEGCPDISELAAFYWDRMDAWYEEDEQVFVHPRDPYHRVDVLESTREIRIELDGVELATSGRSVMLFETGLPVRHYLPRLDVRAALLRPSDTTTLCPYKGQAAYHSVEVDGALHEDLAWYYRTPVRETVPIADRICFFSEKVDTYIDGELQERPVSPWS